MWEFLKSLIKKSPTYSIGALSSPDDVRNIPLESIPVSVVALPSRYETSMPEVEDQGDKPYCVGKSISKLMEKYYDYDLSGRDLYAQCKLADGIPNISGTFPTIGASIALKSGVALNQVVPDDNRLSTTAFLTVFNGILRKKVSGYAFVDNNFDAVCKAVYMNQGIVAASDVDISWFMANPKIVTRPIGRHAYIICGFNYNDQTVRIQNSWGKSWGDNGRLWIKWNVLTNLSDLIAFVPIEKEILDEMKNSDYKFATTMRIGDQGFEVKQLQKRLNISADGKFGRLTQKAVMEYQKSVRLHPDGVVGSATRRALNGTVSLLEAIIQIESGGDDNAIGDKTLLHKAYGCLQIRQPYMNDVNAKTGKNHRAEELLGNRELSIWYFNEYMKIYATKAQLGHDPRQEEIARIHNGGPKGYKNSNTIQYWLKVRKILLGS